MANPLHVPMAGRSIRNLLGRPATVRYPVEIRPAVEGSRGMVEFDLASCVFCGLCVRRCPAAAIGCSREERTFSLDLLRCVACGVCAEVCNKGSLRMSTARRPVMATAGPGAPRPGRRTWQGDVPAMPVTPAPATAPATPPEPEPEPEPEPKAA